MLTLAELRSRYREQILLLAKQHGLENVRVFGSVARGDAHEDSDIDLLVSRSVGSDPWGVGGFYMDIQETLHHKVDVAMETALSPLMRAQVLKEAVPL